MPLSSREREKARVTLAGPGLFVKRESLAGLLAAVHYSPPFRRSHASFYTSHVRTIFHD